jgi:hypothetical protein
MTAMIAVQMACMVTIVSRSSGYSNPCALRLSLGAFAHGLG